MGQQQPLITCKIGCWLLAALAGLLVGLFFNYAFGASVFWSFFFGLLGFLICGYFFPQVFCDDATAHPDLAEDLRDRAERQSLTKAGAAGGAAAAAQDARATDSDHTVASPDDAEAAQSVTAQPASEDAAFAESARMSSDAANEAGGAPMAAESAAKAAAGQSPSDHTEASPDDAQAAASTAAPAQPAKVDRPEMSADASDIGTSAAKTDGADGEQGSLIKPSAPLAGQAELAARKGTWTYQPDAQASSSGAAAAGAVAATATSGAEKGADTSIPDYDGDGVQEGVNEGSRPEALAAPRDGGADDLKQIKGVGPKLEQLCNSLGFYHFDQIAAWSADEVAWVDANLKGFRGRVSRDEWVQQAKILAEGGATEFSRRVDKGQVY